MGSGEITWSLFDLAPDAIVVVTEQGDIVFANDRSGVLFRCAPDQLVGRPIEELLPEELRAAHRAHRARFRASPEVRQMGAGLELRARRCDGTEVLAEISLSPVEQSGRRYVVAAVRDITERVAAEAELRATQAALVEAERAVLLAEDRDRIARDLHDTVIQRLFAAGLSLQAAASTADERVRSRLADVVDELDETIKELRAAIFSLQDRRDVPGLRGRLLDVVTESARASGTEPRLELAGDLDTVDQQVADHLVPVLREALSNVTRHASATRVTVSLLIDDQIHLAVVDDGTGPPGEVLGGHGIANLCDRASSLGGTATLSAVPGGGTRLDWIVPRVAPASDPSA